MNIERKHFNAIDIAKVIAIILVVIGHYFPDDSPEWWVMVHDVIYSFHMPPFFFASGFLYAAAQRPMGYVAFMRRKFMRLMVPYFSASVVIICIKLLTDSGGDGTALDNPVTPMAFLEMFWSPSAGYFLWFIWALMWMFAAVRLAGGRMGRAALAVAAVALAYLPWTFTNLFCIEQARQMFVYFMLGAVGADLRERFPYDRENTVFAIAVSLFVAGEWMFAAGERYAAAVAPLLPYLGIAATLLLARQIDRRAPHVRGWLLRFAPYTYFIYLSHTTFEGVAKAVLRRMDLFAVADGLVFAAGALLVILAGIAGPVLAWRWIEGRVPLLSKAFGGRGR